MKKFTAVIVLAVFFGLLFFSCQKKKFPIDPNGHYTTISCPSCNGTGCDRCEEGLRTIGMKADLE